jgi:pyruvate/2-oxoglutarate dehydrogenase complex dihydrolipoamide dehydrogenase (E3) component
MRLNSEMTAEAVVAANPDALIIATGSRDAKPKISGTDLPHVFTARQVLGRFSDVGKRVVVCDWDGRNMGISVAEALAQRGHEVEIVTSAFYVGQDAELMIWRATYDRLLRYGVRMSALEEVIQITEGEVITRKTDGSTRAIKAETVVLCSKGEAERGLYKSLKGRVKRIWAIGDCWAPRQIEQAVFEGARTAREI